MSENKNISIKGARVNNLKNIDVDIPRNKLVVITGLRDQASHPLHSTRFMLRDSVAMWRASAVMPANSWDG